MQILDNEFIKNITEEGDNVMRILFICGNGVSSGMIASRTGKAGKAQGYDLSLIHILKGIKVDEEA